MFNKRERRLLFTSLALAICVPCITSFILPAAGGTHSFSVRRQVLHVLKTASGGAAGDFKDEPTQPSKPTHDAQGNASNLISPSKSSDPVTRRNGMRRNGLWTAFRLGPPLLLKFAIVLVIKFIMDLVIFPSLFLYRLIRISLKKLGTLLIHLNGTITTEARNQTSIYSQKTIQAT